MISIITKLYEAWIEARMMRVRSCRKYYRMCS